MSVDIQISGNNNKTYLILNSPYSSIKTDNSSNNLNIQGVDLDGYLISASGEAFNFKQLYNQVNNTFDTSGVLPLTIFNTDLSFGRFNISINNPPEVLLLQLTGGFDIFRKDKDGNNKENKNTFLRILLNAGNDVSNIAVTPITTLISETFIELSEKDLSNGIAINDLSFEYLLNKSEDKVLKLLGPDFSGVNQSFLNKDPYDELQKAEDSSDNELLKKGKNLLNANFKIFSLINTLCDGYDGSLNDYSKEKDKKYRRKCMRKFLRRRRKHYDLSGVDMDESIEKDNDIRKIEREAAEELGIDYNDISNNKKTNEEFLRRMPKKYNEEKRLMDASGVDKEEFIDRLNDIDDILDDMKKDKKDDGKPKSKPKPEEETVEGEEHEYDKFYREEKDKRKSDRQNGNRPSGKPNGGFRPPWKK
tara:strand:+ start:613 stop:1869 length:1257 start_codon:yes stop_codon:yes gene_type:complete